MRLSKQAEAEIQRLEKQIEKIKSEAGKKPSMGFDSPYIYYYWYKKEKSWRVCARPVMIEDKQKCLYFGTYTTEKGAFNMANKLNILCELAVNNQFTFDIFSHLKKGA